MERRHTFLILAAAVFVVSILSTLAVNASCGDDYAAVADTTVQKLFAHINGRWSDTLKHELTLREDGAHITIGSLTLEDPTFLRLLARVTKQGQLAELAGGRIIGPKALNFVVHLQEMAPASSHAKFTGSVNPKSLFETQARQLADTKKAEQMKALGKEYAVDPASVWTDSDIEKFEQALVKFKIEDACARLWKTRDLRLCKNMKFEFTAGDLEHIAWSPAK